MPQENSIPVNPLRILLLLAILATPWIGHSQGIVPTPGETRLDARKTWEAMAESGWLSQITFKSVGPSIFSGRVVDLAVNPANSSEFLVAYASGGLWHTTTNGASFTPLFDQEAVMTIGAIATDWTNRTIWVGTGEVNSSRSSYAGVGMYFSPDFGQHWQYKGLPESHHIGRVILHPDDPATVWVAVLGHLYSDNPERGVYRTTNGGDSWERTLFVDDRSGAVDLILDPRQSDHLYAAIWERDRKAWNLSESGSSSGIYETRDGGGSWELISSPETGFPTGEGVGRIGLAMGYRGDQPEVYAILDNQNRRPVSKAEQDTSRISKSELRTMTRAAFLSLPPKKIQRYLDDHDFPEQYDAEKVIQLIRQDSIQPSALVDYIEEANSLLFDTPVVGAEVYRLPSGRSTWEKTHEEYLDDIFYSYGYYFGQIRVQVEQPDQLFIMGVPVLRSLDGGKTFSSIHRENVHADHHALWINPADPGHLILGNDGGINISQDTGRTWIRANRPPVGQFYSVNVDDRKPFNLYGGLQDNGVWKGPSTYNGSLRWEMTGQYPYRMLLGGDGMQVEIDPREENRIVYTGYQFGFYYRIDTETGDQQLITPKPALGQRPYRWNWQTPIHLSRHQPDILYMGAQKLLRSLDRGDHFDEISGDLTRGGRQGDVPYGTLTSIHESPLRFGLLYTGSDDGLVHVSRDGGYSWTRITDGLPEDLWVSRIQASQHKEGRVYLALNGYRWDLFDALVYRSDDYGQTWQQIGLDLPAEPVNVIREDPENPDLIYVGTDHGVYASLDRGQRFMPLDRSLPRVPVHDLVIHRPSGTLVLGTHGRSFYSADIRKVQVLKPEITDQELVLFDPEDVDYNPNWGKSWSKWQEPQDPGLTVWTFSRSDRNVEYKIFPEGHPNIILASGEAAVGRGLSSWTYSLDVANTKALNQWSKHLAKSGDEAPLASDNGKTYLLPGTYILSMQEGELEVQKQFRVVRKKKRGT